MYTGKLWSKFQFANFLQTPDTSRDTKEGEEHLYVLNISVNQIETTQILEISIIYSPISYCFISRLV